MPYRFLGVLLCYNDGDMLSEAIDHLLENDHEIVVWNHGSSDETASILERRRGDLLEVTDISRAVDFYDLYPLMSKHLLARYVRHYDWISWPDQDEILEAPSRANPYRALLDQAVESRHSWIEFRDFVYWFTSRDDPAIASPSRRIRHYALARHGAPKIRSWRASATNIRWFNHNKAEGSRYPALGNLRHYPMRSAAQMQRRVSIDRAGLQRGPVNSHYEHMRTVLPGLALAAEELHYDDGVSDLDERMTFDWSRIYGSGPRLPAEVAESFLLATRRWEVADAIRTSLGRLPAEEVSRVGSARLDRWRSALDGKIACPVLVALKRDDVKIITEDIAASWPGTAAGDAAAPAAQAERSIRTSLGGMPVAVSANAATRHIRIATDDHEGGAVGGEAPLVALVPCYDRGEPPRVRPLERGAAAFGSLRGTYYYLACEPAAGQGA
jgi:hypothetical protein